MSFKIEINAENGVDAATQFKAFLMNLQLAFQAPQGGGAGQVQPHPTVEGPGTKEEKPEAASAPKAKRVSTKKQVVEDDEDEAPAPKAKKKVVEEDEEEEAPKPKAKAKAKAVEEDEEEPVAPEKKAKEPEELVDDGGDQPATIDGCRIMIRRVARTPGLGPEHSRAILAEFGVPGAKSVPEKKIQKFIDRCQEVIDDPESIDVEASDE